MKIFIDFDDVIFNTKKFIVDYKAIFKRHGISEKIYERYYYDYSVNKDKKFKKYDSRMHIKEIGKKLSIDIKKIENDISNFTRNTSKYVFKDAYKFIKWFRKKDLNIVTFPKIKFQGTKIENSGIKKYFNQSILSNSSKAKAIIGIIKKEKINKKEVIYFIDDRLEHVEDVKKKIPRVIAILLTRWGGRYKYSPKGNFNYKAINLDEVLKIINQEKLK